MKFLFFFPILILFQISGCSQESKVMVLERFLEELKVNQEVRSEWVVNYFRFETGTSEHDVQEKVLPILSIQLQMIRERLVKCKEIEIISHDVKSDLIISYALNTQEYKTSNVFYIICDGEIITPVLMDGDMIQSITTVSKNDTGAKRFLVFY